MPKCQYDDRDGTPGAPCEGIAIVEMQLDMSPTQRACLTHLLESTAITAVGGYAEMHVYSITSPINQYGEDN